MSETMTNSIAVTLKTHPLCLELTQFFLRHENAMDTAKGIADCWVQRDRAAVQTALDHLVACGLVSINTLSSGQLYFLTRRAEIRAWLRTAYPGSEPPA